MIFRISPGCRGLQHGNDSNLNSSVFVRTDNVLKHGCATVDVGVTTQKKWLDPLCSAGGKKMSSEIPEELCQAQFLRSLRHHASASLH